MTRLLKPCCPLALCLLSLLLFTPPAAPSPQRSGTRPTSTPSSSRPSRTRCREECTKIFTPVCGSDGATYNNLCIMEAESCKAQEADPSRPTITKVHDGACAVPAGSSSSSSSSNRPQTSGLRPSQDLAATAPQASVVSPRPRCDDKCTAGLRPVCGSNGVTYGSQCLFDVAQCKDPSLRKVDDGVCTKDCTIQCSQDPSPVCGTDGVTYLNLCYLIIAQCKDGSIKKASDGACVSTPVRRACQLTCTTEYSPVCGSNGVTYTNACTLQQATCELQGLVQLYSGQCRHQ